MPNYVQFNGTKHFFSNEQEKKALIKEAKNFSRYVIVEGISTIVKFSASDCAEIARECGLVKDNSK